jgi:hypothetical protein
MEVSMRSTVLAACAVLLGLLTVSCERKEAIADIANPDPTRCIVSGEKLPPKPTIVEVQGKKYALCCGDCEPDLRKDLDHYLKNPGSGSMPKGSNPMPKK